MSDDDKKPAEAAPEPDPKASEADAAPAAAAAPEPEATAADMAQAVADAEKRLLHALADMENLRRRTEREVADAHRYAISNFAREMLNVGDNLQRALDAVPAERREDEAVASLIAGVEVTARSLEQTLEKFGVKRIVAEGQKFDPSMHQAMMEVEDADAAPGSVAQEIQVGYAIGDRVLRPAFVSVVKKPKASKTPAANDDTPAEDVKPSG